MSSFLPVETGVPQGSLTGPLLFIIYVNDFPLVGNQITTYLYADDTSIFIERSDEREIQNTVNMLVPKIEDWFVANQLSFNTDN